MRKTVLIFFIFHFSFFILKAQRYYLYGEASSGGHGGDGVLFWFDPFTGKDSDLFNFNGSNGRGPARNLYLDQNGLLYGGSEFGGIKNNGVMFSYNLNNGRENTLVDFTDSNGSNFAWGSTLYKGILYCTTALGGAYNDGIIFTYNPNNNEDSVVFNFNDTDGSAPYGGLFVLNDTSFFGMTEYGGTNNVGVLYSFNPLTNKERVLLNFNKSTTGGWTQGGLIECSNKLLYGMTGEFGPEGGGVLFSFNPVTNVFSPLVNLSPSLGDIPFGNLLLATNGLLYGMTASGGGSNNDGVLFSYDINTNRYTIVIDFNGTNGSFGDDGLIEDTANKVLYCMTEYGGKYNDGVIFSYNLNTGKDSVLLNFNGTNGANPYGTLLLVPYQSEDGINELRANREEIRVYPNPAANFVNIETSVSDEKYFYLYDELGELMEKSTLTNSMNTILLSNVASGLYYYRVVDNEQNVIKSDKLLIIR